MGERVGTCFIFRLPFSASMLVVRMRPCRSTDRCAIAHPAGADPPVPTTHVDRKYAPKAWTLPRRSALPTAIGSELAPLRRERTFVGAVSGPVELEPSRNRRVDISRLWATMVAAIAVRRMCLVNSESENMPRSTPHTTHKHHGTSQHTKNRCTFHDQRHKHTHHGTSRGTNTCDTINATHKQ